MNDYGAFQIARAPIAIATMPPVEDMTAELIAAAMQGYIPCYFCQWQARGNSWVAALNELANHGKQAGHTLQTQ